MARLCAVRRSGLRSGDRPLRVDSECRGRQQRSLDRWTGLAAKVSGRDSRRSELAQPGLIPASRTNLFQRRYSAWKNSMNAARSICAGMRPRASSRRRIGSSLDALPITLASFCITDDEVADGATTPSQSVSSTPGYPNSDKRRHVRIGGDALRGRGRENA